MGIATRIMVTGLQSGVITAATKRIITSAQRHWFFSYSGFTTPRATSIQMNTGVSNETPRPSMNQPEKLT